MNTSPKWLHVLMWGMMATTIVGCLVYLILAPLPYPA
jgi:hypothetical protein